MSLRCEVRISTEGHRNSSSELFEKRTNVTWWKTLLPTGPGFRGGYGVYLELLARHRDSGVVDMVTLGERLRLDRATLGICLGAQLMAQALGAGVSATGRVEIGYAPLKLTTAGRSSVLRHLDRVPVLHWHGDQFDIPAGAERLAETSGFPNQAFARTPDTGSAVSPGSRSSADRTMADRSCP